MTLIAPSILSADFGRLGEEIRGAEAAGADWIHVDVMDGHFVPNITIGPLVAAAARRATGLPIDVHLMIEKPERYVEDFVKAGADWLTVHAEATVHLHRTIQQIRDAGARPGVALNPATPVSAIQHVLSDVDLVLIMSVNPGFGGQAFIPGAIDKVRELRHRIRDTVPERELLVQIDGGINAGTVLKVVEAGADVLVMGSAFFGERDRGAFVRRIRDIIAPVKD